MLLSEMRSPKIAIKAYQALACEGMARVDFFIHNNDEIVINELNTMPSFTSNSLYHRLRAISNLTLSDLIDKLIEFAFARHLRDKQLKTSLE